MTPGREPPSATGGGAVAVIYSDREEVVGQKSGLDLRSWTDVVGPPGSARKTEGSCPFYVRPWSRPTWISAVTFKPLPKRRRVVACVAALFPTAVSTLPGKSRACSSSSPPARATGSPL